MSDKDTTTESKYQAKAWRTKGAQIEVKAETFWLELGHLRSAVALADANGLPDGAEVELAGIKKSYSTYDKFTAASLVIRSVGYDRVEPSSGEH